MSFPPFQRAFLKRPFGLGFLVLVIGLSLAATGSGQVSPEDHAKHHPGQDKDKGAMPGMAADAKVPAKGMNDGTAAPAAGKDAGMGGGMEGMMDGMMKKMGVPPPKDLYPTLMSLPELTSEQREQVRVQADERMRSGVALLSVGLERLAKSTENEDYAAMQAATAEVREALARFESGVAAKRALAEGKPPRQVALQWFKSEMNLASPIPRNEPYTLLGVSPFHLFTMVLLIAFALAMVAMYFVKMRRAAALFGRIEADKGPPPPGSAPPLTGSPGPVVPSATQEEQTPLPAADAGAQST